MLWPVITCMFLAGLCVAQGDHNVPSSYISNLSSFPCCQLTLQNAKFWIAAAEHHQLCTDSVPTLDCCLLRCITDCHKLLNISNISMIFCVRYYCCWLKWVCESKREGVHSWEEMHFCHRLCFFSFIFNEWKWSIVGNQHRKSKKRSTLFFGPQGERWKQC